VLPRDKLVGVLYKHVLDNYSDRIEVNYGYEVTPIDFAAGDGTLVVVRCVISNDNIVLFVAVRAHKHVFVLSVLQNVLKIKIPHQSLIPTSSATLRSLSCYPRIF
jgi:hypothetical protein